MSFSNREQNTENTEAIKLQIKKSFTNPNVKNVFQITLKNGPQAFRFATIFEIVDQKKIFHHYVLRLDSFRRTKKHGWEEKPDKQITLESKEPDEIDLLARFINRTLKHELPMEDGKYQIIETSKYKSLTKLINEKGKADSQKKWNSSKQYYQD